MILHKGNLYRTNVTKTLNLDTKFKINENKDILVVGAGISGAITAYRLSKEGFKVTLIEKNKAGMGSTAANTGLIQYVSDKLLSEFKDQIEQNDANNFYKMSVDAVKTLHEINDDLEELITPTFKKTDSIILANEVKKIDQIKKEAEEEINLGLPASYLNMEELQKNGINSYAALLCKDDINLNPYGFVNRLLSTAINKYDLDFLEETEILDIQSKGDYEIAKIRVYGKEDYYKFKKIIFATGYNPPSIFDEYLENLIINKTYVVVSDDNINYDKKSEYLVWEKKEKYDYFKYTLDNRLLIGGSDKESDELKDSDVGKEDNNLLRSAQNMLTNELNFNKVYSYVALFGESKDNLPIIGEDPNNTNLFLICGVGGNGTVYSTIASEIIKKWIKNEDISEYDFLKINR